MGIQNTLQKTELKEEPNAKKLMKQILIAAPQFLRNCGSSFLVGPFKC